MTIHKEYVPFHIKINKQEDEAKFKKESNDYQQKGGRKYSKHKFVFILTPR